MTAFPGSGNGVLPRMLSQVTAGQPRTERTSFTAESIAQRPALRILTVISVVIPAHEALAHYRDCLSSLAAQDYRDFEVIWVDSASRDGSLERVREEFPSTRVIALPSNAGYRGGTNAGCAEARGELIVVANQDVRFDAGFLTALAEGAGRYPEAAIFAPKILDFDDPDRINEAGNTLHFTGLYGSRGLGAPAGDLAEESVLAAMSGCGFMVRRSAWTAAGGFSRDFDLYDSGWHASYEDADLAWRVQLAGHTIRYLPGAVMFHKFARKPMTPARFRSYEWGRWMTLARNYSLATLLLLGPALLAVECGMLLFAASRGMLGAKLGPVLWIVRHAPLVLERRRAVQATRRVPDSVILQRMAATIDVSHHLRGLLDAAARRVLDLAVAGTLLVAAAPLMLLVALLIRVTMGRPVLFAQIRPGLDERLFTLYKFRTMSGNRVTGLGRILRRWSVDELPQLLNVIRGELSLVGPRPLLPDYLPLYTPEQARRHAVKPGITGWAQIHGRNALTWEEKFALDVWYVDHRSLLLDLRILSATLKNVLTGRGVDGPGNERFLGTPS